VQLPRDYKKYKQAKTYAEFKKCGGLKIDLQNDFRKRFVHFIPPDGKEHHNVEDDDCAEPPHDAAEPLHGQGEAPDQNQDREPVSAKVVKEKLDELLSEPVRKATADLREDVAPRDRKDMTRKERYWLLRSHLIFCRKVFANVTEILNSRMADIEFLLDEIVNNSPGGG
jgi:hypothetical protein